MLKRDSDQIKESIELSTVPKEEVRQPVEEMKEALLQQPTDSESPDPLTETVSPPQNRHAKAIELQEFQTDPAEEPVYMPQ